MENWTEQTMKHLMDRKQRSERQMDGGMKGRDGLILEATLDRLKKYKCFLNLNWSLK